MDQEATLLLRDLTAIATTKWPGLFKCAMEAM